MKFCTVVAGNYLAYARVLAQSLHKVYDDADVSVLILDDEDCALDDSREPFTILRPADLDIEPREFHHMAVIYDILELATAVKPWLLQHLLETDEVACYLDPDIEAFSSLDEIERLALRHSIVLTPHTTTPMPRDGFIPSEQTIRLAGVFNLGFIAVSRDAMPFLAWWSERLRRDCRVAVAQGLFVDQRWIDFVPAYFEHTVLTDEGYNVAYWNLYEREVKIGADGYQVNGRPLRFYHFSGFDPMRPHMLSKHQVGIPRIRLEDQFEVAYLCNQYASRIMAAGHLEALEAPYRYNYTAFGVSIDHRVRLLYRNALTDDEEQGRTARLPDPFNPTEAGAFMTWLAGPGPAGSETRISRYIRQVYEERPDVAKQFPDLAGFGGVQMLEWIRRHGRENAGVLPECVPAPIRTPRPDAADLPEGVNLVGYLRAEDGVGAVARSVLDVLNRTGSAVSLRNCASTASRQSADLDETRSNADTTYDVTIACVNADQFPLLINGMGDRLPVAASTVGFWAWEVEGFPEWMARSAALVDEIWVYSRHAADAVASMVEVPVHVFAPPVAVPESLFRIDRGAAGLTDDFTFLFCFDFRSGFERKNPLAVISAFKKAFAPGEGPRLIIKSVNRAVEPVAWARMEAAAGDRADIELRDGYEPARRQRNLIAAADCYVSLHRAEGYGLTMAEAMAAGRPVIGTAYSGNLEFMTSENSVLVPYDMERIPFGTGPYPPTASWAAADTDAAATAMRNLASDPEMAARLGAAARTHIVNEHTVGSRVDFVRGRLHEFEEQSMSYFDPARPPEERIQHAMVHGPDMTAAGRFGGLTRFMRHIVGRAVKYERDFNLQIDVALLDKLHEIEETSADQLHAVDERLQIADHELRVADDELRDVDRRAERDRLELQERIGTLEQLVGELQKHLQEVDTRAAVANTLAAGAAHGFDMMARDTANFAGDLAQVKLRIAELNDEASSFRTGTEKAGFVYEELTALPYLADESTLRYTDERGRDHLGYRGVVGASPLYTGFEDIFRGPASLVRERQRVYLDVIGDRGPVADLGCGRGEMLELLVEAGIEAFGVDLDEDMVERARSSGAEVHHGDALSFLMKQEDASLGAIFSAQFIEHVPSNTLPELLEVSRSKLRPGGVFIAETVNPHSHRALKAFWIDPTHQHPLFPETMLALCRLTGFENAEIMFPLGNDDLVADLRTCGEYAVIAGARELG